MVKVFNVDFEGEERKEYERLVLAARKIQRGRNVVFHGTRFPAEIIATNVLKAGRTGDRAICFSRSPEVAAYWALMPRDVSGEMAGILVVDKNALKARYKLEPFHDECWDDCTSFRDEGEERIWDRDVTDIARLTMALVR
ncbi:hypothetical protein IHQ71_11685 [Rhizobium sp. TH2]|uniref:hypothetical protein n=1 Tax=Rhizobium sp. TH2 TaxID=2775403 RepID=UPI0021589994|nr:hypothetical protein [Rhizobium sp. TH2]UVC11172.1 hypothetical protein IHQ71_11685 [Rhizobium sp. TH2]